MLPRKPMNSRRLIAAPESRGGILSSKTERVEAAHNVRFGSKADMGSARAHVRYKRTSEGDRPHDRGHDQRYSTSRAIPTRSRHTQAAIDSPVIARRRIAEIPRLCCLAWAVRNCAASIASSKSLHL